MLPIALLALAAALVASGLAPIMRRTGFAVGAVDRPGHRKVHATDVSRLGGVAVWGAVAAVVALAGAFGVLDGADFARVRVMWVPLALGAALLAAVGVVDDVRGLHARTKLAAQFLASALVVSGGCVIREATNPISGASVALGMLAVPVTVLWVIGVTNALNLIDGPRRPRGGRGPDRRRHALPDLAVGGPRRRRDAERDARGRARRLPLFQLQPGDDLPRRFGSLFLGYVLAGALAEAAHKGATAVLVMAPILALGLLIMDTMLAVGRPPVVSSSMACRPTATTSITG
jgi:UDP-GlcNAc:undecaprenyl-phosphate GlcNAc-1-phosphate transferase